MDQIFILSLIVTIGADSEELVVMVLQRGLEASAAKIRREAMHW